MNTLPLLLALAAVALAQAANGTTCVAAPLDGHQLTADGYPTMSVSWNGTGIVIQLSMSQIVNSRNASVVRVPAASFFTENATASPATLAFPAWTSPDNCTLSNAAFYNLTELLSGGGWSKYQEGIFWVYLFTVEVAWADPVYMYDVEKGLNTTTAEVRMRPVTSHLRFNVRVQRYVTADSNITFLTPLTMYAVTRRMDVSYEPQLHVAIDMSVLVHDNFNVTSATITNLTGAFTEVTSVEIGAWTLAPGQLKAYVLPHTLQVLAGTCSFAAAPSSYTLVLNVTDATEAHIWYTVLLEVRVSDSEDWCPRNVSSVTFSGAQDTFADSLLTRASSRFFLADTVYIGARFNVTSPAEAANLPFSVISATATAVALASNATPFALALAPVSPCPAAFKWCGAFPLTPRPDMFVSLYAYAVTVEYQLLAAGGKRSSVVLSASRAGSVALSTHIVASEAHQDTPKGGEEATPQYMVGVVGALGGVAAVSVVAAVAAVGAYAVHRRRSAAAHQRLVEGEQAAL